MSVTCNFCSRNDTSVQVICESSCLLCSRCQSTSTIRQLLLNFANPSIYDKNSIAASISGGPIPSPGCCPICKRPMTRGMFLIMLDFIEIMKESGKVNIHFILKFQKILIFDVPAKFGFKDNCPSYRELFCWIFGQFQVLC